MESKLRIELLVGLIFFCAMGILGYYTVIMSHEIIKPENTYMVTVHFTDTGGLTVKDRVYVNGVHSGAVSGITLREGFVETELELFNKFILYENYRLVVKSDAVLGGKQINIFPGKPAGPDGSTFAVVDKNSILKGKLEDPFASITSLIEENRGNIYATIKNVREFTEKMNKGKGTLARLLNDDKLVKQTDTLLKEVRETLEDAREQAPVTSFIRAALTAF